ncbi:MAG: hypothetical protein LC128_08705 [Chitinophagales bacterium]|nr:hypothetical protein [Chitinophagales bacterium]
MPDIFNPYKVLEYIPGKSIELGLSSWRRKFYFIFFRIFPVALIIFMTSVYLLEQKAVPVLLVLASLMSVLAIVLFLRKYTFKTIISGTGVELHRKAVSGEEQIIINKSEIEKIQCKMRHGKGGGAFFFIRTVDKRKISILTIPVINMKEKNIHLIKDELKNILGTDIQMI